MINTNTLDQLMPLVRSLSLKNKGVAPVAGTPLGQLTEAGKTGAVFATPMNGNETPEVTLNALKESIFYSTTKADVGGVVPHSLIMDELAAFIGPHVANHIAFAKNVVNPRIKDVLARLQQNIEGMPSRISLMKVTNYSPSPLFLNRLVNGTIEEYKEHMYNPNITLPFSLNDTSFEEITKLMMTNSSSMDKDIVQWAANQKASDVEEVFTQVFGLKNKDTVLGNVVKNYAVYGYGWSYDIEKLLFIFFVARGLIDNPPDYLKIGLDVYNGALKELVNSVGNRLYVEYLNYDNAIGSNKNLVRNINKYNDEVVVYAPSYKAYLEQGGTTEALLGLLFFTDNVGNDFPFTTEKVLEHKADLEAIYQKQVAIISLTETNNRFVSCKQVLRSTILGVIQEEYTANPADVDMAVLSGKLEDELVMVKRDDFDNLAKLTMRVLCRTIYAHTAAEDILESINRISTEHPNLPIRDVSAIAAIEYMACYLFDQMKLV